MIFQFTHELVMSGQKTQTRRIVKPGDTPTFISANTWRFHPDPKRGYSGVRNNERWRWYINQELAVQPGRGQKAIGRIKILYVRREDVREISAADAKAEGFEDSGAEGRLDFLSVWVSMHDKPMTFERDTEHWDFDGTWNFKNKGLSDSLVALYWLSERPAERYQAWVIDFELVRS